MSFIAANRLNKARRVLTHALLGLLLCAGAGCRTVSYYHQAVQGHWQVWTHQQSIPDLLADPQTPPRLREKFQLVLELREFARGELGLAAGHHYLGYVDLERPYVVWNVVAAPEFSLEAKSWWYPLVGRLTYRGYFDEAAARERARELQREGFDVHVGGVKAYSTLGAFSDPVLNTFIHDERTELADLLFHELAHLRLFVPGDTDFNEAFATAVAREGVRRWLIARGDEDGLARWKEQIRFEEAFVRLVLKARDELDAIYKQAVAPEVLRAKKAAVLDRLRRDFAALKEQAGGLFFYDHWLTGPLNNARLNTVATYHHLLPGFEDLLRQSNGSLPEFYEAVRALGRMSKDERRANLRSLALGGR